jgi:cell division protein FtsI/penicillin-binding protein 2
MAKKKPAKTPERSERRKKGNPYRAALALGLRFVGMAAYLGVAVAIFALVYWRLGDLTGRYQNRAGDAEAALQSYEDSTLFINLVRANLIVPRDSDSGLDMAPPDYVLIKRASGKNQDEDDDGISEGEQETLLKALYDSAAGTIVRTQVNLWNGTRRMGAVRDDRAVGEGDANKVLWKAASEGGIPKPLTNLVPESFGFVNKDQIPKGMSEWVAVAGARENEKIVFLTNTGSYSGVLHVQVIGRPVKVPPGARVDRRTYDFFSERGELKWACKTVAEAAVVTINARADTPLEITVEPAANCSPSVFGLAISMAGEDLAGRPAKRPKRKKSPRAKDKDPGVITTGTIEWSYNWRPVQRATPTSSRADKLFVVRTVDGVALTDPNGKGTPTQAANEMGLISLLGYSRADSMSIIGLMSGSKLPGGNTEVTLTLDSRVQRIVQSTLTHHVTRVIDGNRGGRGGQGRFYHERRASITVLDADTGAVVAIGSWPLVPLGARPWDYVSYQITNPTKDPTMIASWQLLTIDNTPGSTWKTITSITSALEASDPKVQPDPAIGQMVLGMDPATFQRRLGIPITAGTVPIPGSTTRSISNLGGGMATGGPLRSPVCTDTGQGVQASTLNVSVALKHSYNVYFARLAMLLEERHVNEWLKSLPKNPRTGKTLNDVKQLPPTRMMIRMKQLGIDWEEPLNLAANLDDRQPLLRIKSKNTFDKLYVRPPLTAITSNVNLMRDNPPEAYRPDYMHRIALNGIGQAWSVSTMHIAISSATLAKGARVRPYIIAGWGRERLGPPKPPPGETDQLNIRGDLLSAMRLGMKAVTEAPGATASGVFAQEPVMILGEEYAKVKGGDIGKRVAAIRQANAKNGVKPIWCRAYGKTGTADPKKGGGYNSGWFTGWKEPLQAGGRRFAIGCMVSHLDHAFGGPRFGGAVCGAIVRDIMMSLETMEKPDLRANPGEDEPKPQPDAPEGTEEDTDTPRRAQ